MIKWKNMSDAEKASVGIAFATFAVGTGSTIFGVIQSIKSNKKAEVLADYQIAIAQKQLEELNNK